MNSLGGGDEGREEGELSEDDELLDRMRDELLESEALMAAIGKPNKNKTNISVSSTNKTKEQAPKMEKIQKNTPSKSKAASQRRPDTARRREKILSPGIRQVIKSWQLQSGKKKEHPHFEHIPMPPVSSGYDLG